MSDLDEDKFWVNEIWDPKYGLIIAACDADLLGLTLKKGSLDIYVSERFYGGKLVNKDRLITLMKKAKSINIIGEKVVKIAEENGLIHSEAKIYFRDHGGRYIPHAMMIKMEF